MATDLSTPNTATLNPATTTSVSTTVDSNPPTKDESVSTDENRNPEYVKGFKLFVLVGSSTIIGFLLLLDMAILGTAIPVITSTFHSLPDVGWYSGAYQLCCAALQPLTGKLYTHLRIKHVFLANLFVFEVGSLICGTANSSAMLIGGRAVAGMGGAGLMNGAITILSASVAPEKRPMYIGMFMGVAQMGIVSGPLIGGALTEHATWRWCFYINLPIGAAAAVAITLIRIPDLTPKDPYSFSLFRKVIPQLDLPGFALFAPACVMLLLALQFGGDGTHAWSSATVVGLLVGAGIAAAVFVFWEARIGDQAMIPGALLNSRLMLACTGYQLSLGVLVLVGSLWLPIYFQSIRGASPTMSGVDLLASILAQLLFTVVSGGAVSKMGYYLPWAVFCGAISAIGNGLLTLLDMDTSTAKWIGYLIIVGSGRGAGMQMALVATQSALPPSLIPVSLAFLLFLQNLGGAIFAVVANTIFTQSLISKLRQYAPSVSAHAALEAGGSAAAVRALTSPGHEDESIGVLNAYNESLRNVWYMLVGFAVITFLCAWGMGWVDVRKKEVKAEEGERAEEIKSKEVEV